MPERTTQLDAASASRDRRWNRWEREPRLVREQPPTVPGMTGAGGPPVVEATLTQLTERARALVASGERRILGITGPPGAGKSTLCSALLEALGDDAVLIGMDGFHYSNEELVRLGRRQRKGAPDTFDVDGYVALLRRLRSQTGATIYAPVFNRGVEASIGSAVPVFAETPLVITEGNYLLVTDGGWDEVGGCLDEVWYIEVEAPVRGQRLVLRRQSYGELVSDAEAWVAAVDERNAALVEPTRSQADLIVHLITTQ
jgi:pantothenate kinase